jgi:hypothetical protein
MMRQFDRMGAPGCIGLMDCVHIDWTNVFRNGVTVFAMAGTLQLIALKLRE